MKYRFRSGFTLIEVLVVIAIMGILAGLVFPAIQRGMLSAKRNAAVSEARAIAGAIELFYKDYGWMPLPPNEQGYARNSPAEDNQPMTDEKSKEIIQVLMATASDTVLDEQNPRRKVYLDLDRVSEDGELLDPWGMQYLIKLDVDFDGKLQYQSGTKQYNTRVIVMSRGRNRITADGASEASEDDVANVILDIE